MMWDGDQKTPTFAPRLVSAEEARATRRWPLLERTESKGMMCWFCCNSCGGSSRHTMNDWWLDQILYQQLILSRDTSFCCLASCSEAADLWLGRSWVSLASWAQASELQRFQDQQKENQARCRTNCPVVAGNSSNMLSIRQWFLCSTLWWTIEYSYRTHHHV